MDIVESLIKVGFTRHESLLYLTLCKEGVLTGYEAAKLSGIPRSNAYLALAGLVDKGGAYRSDGEAVRYVAVPAKDLVGNLKREYDIVLNHIEKETPSKEIPVDAYITIAGQTAVKHRIRNMLSQAEFRIYLALTAEFVEVFRAELEDAVGRGLRVVIITEKTFELSDASVYFRDRSPGSVRLITDSSQVLTGEMKETGFTCLFSKNPTLVQLIKESLTNEIKLIELTSSAQ